MLKNKILVAILGIFFFGGIGAYAGIHSTDATAATQQTTLSSKPPTSTATAAPTNTPVPTDTATPVVYVQDTPIPTISVPTQVPTPKPTATPTSNTATVDLHGAILSISSSRPSFTMSSTTGGTVLVNTGGQTTFTGSSSSFSGLRPGWNVEVLGSYASDGSVTATLVNSNGDN